MYVFGTQAFDPQATPEALYRIAQHLRDDQPDMAEAMEGFAHDLATIQALPVVPDPLARVV